VWDAERRARELVTRRDELVRRLPREIRAAGRLTEDVRELIVDDSIEFAALRYEYPVTSTHELERAFWDACAKRTRRGLERRYDTVRGQFTRADEHAIETLVGDHDPVAELERAQERALAREFAATLEPHERRVLVCKYDTDGSEPAGYKVIARRLGLGIGRVRSAERSIERKIDRFAAVYAAGRLCDLRETAVSALAAGTADPRQATTALAHVKHCGHCRPFYAQQLRELGSDGFARKVASLLPVAELQQRGRVHGTWDAFVDTLTRPFAHESTTTAAQLASSGAGRGVGTIAALKIAGACMASAGALSVCATTLVLPALDTPERPDKPTRKVAEREPRPVGQHDRLPSRAEQHVTPTATPTPTPVRSPRDTQRTTQGGTGPSDHEQTPASSAPANAAAGGESEFDPTYKPSSTSQPDPVQAAPGSGEFF
jgi:hypothetical protein